MSKLAAAFHGAPCRGQCCRDPDAECRHGWACVWHLRGDDDDDEKEVEE